jgi:uncharacterized protein (TIGR03437 family)
MTFRATGYILAAALAATTGLAPDCSAAVVNTQVVAGAPLPTSTSFYRQPITFGGFVQTVPVGQGVPIGSVILTESGTQIGFATLDAQGRYSIVSDSLLVGRHTLMASYVGTTNFGPSNSPNIVQVVNAASTLITLTASSTNAQANQVIAFGATVANAPPSVGVPVGSVNFYDGNTLLSTVPLPSSGPAQYSKALSIGLHSVSAVFAPADSNSLSSTSQAIAISVGNNVTIALAANPPTPAVAKAATLVATVSGPGTAPTGSVQFFDGLQSLGSAPLISGQCNIQATFTTVGAHNITVNYSGDSTYLASSANFSLNVGKVQSTITVNASTTSIAYGQPVTLTSQIGPQLAGVGAPSGQVTFFDGSNQVGAATPSSGFALLTLTTVPPGRHLFTAFYSGDANWQPAQSNPIAVSVDLASTLTNITLVRSSAQQATLSAQVNVLPPSTGTATGTVQFIDSLSHVVLGSAALSGGVATATIALQGATPVAALYVGDGNFGSSTSIPTSVVFVINAAGTVVPAFAPDELIAIFGSNLARQVAPAPGLPLPTDLGAVTIDVVDAVGVSRRAPLSYVSPSQVNALLPANTAFGPATLNLTTGYGLQFPIDVTITPTAPGIFTANSDGRGVPAATVLRVKADGTQIPENAISFDIGQRKWVAVPIDVSTDSVYLLLYGTGLRNIADTSAAPCLLNQTQVKPAYAGAQPSFPGLDQVNILLPSSLAGTGTVTVQLTINGQKANPVTIAVR